MAYPSGRLSPNATFGVPKTLEQEVSWNGLTQDQRNCFVRAKTGALRVSDFRFCILDVESFVLPPVAPVAYRFAVSLGTPKTLPLVL